METNLKFNSAICTSREQSKRLLDLGVKAETADMYHYVTSNGTGISAMDDNFLPHMDTLAWSLHRLIEMCNKAQFGMTISIYNNEVTVDGDLFEVFDNTYDNLISIIEWLIDLNKFNKKYLEE